MMIRKNSVILDYPTVSMEGAVGVRMGILLGPDDGAPNFVLRKFILEPGGRTPFHTHAWEHEIYVLKGTGEARHSGGTVPMNPGTVILAEPGELHCFSNTGEGPLEFLCIVPRS
jgi:quercetin dioxygenase-like cupin family protein